MNCPQCSTDLPTDAAFCLQCGAQVGEVLPLPEDQLLRALEKALGSAYEIVRLLGRGGMGAVYLGRDRALDRLVAIKVLPPESTDPESTERFRREARTAASLNHPNIVPLYTFGEGEGILYFVMGYVSGESLRDRIKRLGRIEAGEARRILVEIAGALHYAHEQHVVHRDVKPDNILLEDETGKPMLTDFGVAKSATGGETLTQLGTALGTPYYMSPEQAAGEKQIDGRSDLYSLGVIGYQMLAGQLPFEGETVREVLLQHVTREPVALKTLAPAAPDDLVRAITACLAKQPEDRVSTADVLRSALGTTADEEDEDLPEALAELVQLTRSIPWLSAAFWYVSYWTLLWGEPAAAAGFFAIGAMWPPMLEAKRRNSKLTEHSWKSIIKRAFRKPKWWSMWWPKWLRRDDEVWDRLPKEIRHARGAFSIITAMIFLLIPPMMRTGLGSPSLFWIDVVAPLLAWIILPTAGASMIPLVRSAMWTRRHGLTANESERFVFAGEREARFWRQPHIQKLLAPVPEGGPMELPAPQTTRDYVRALESAARSLSGSEREIADEALSVGRQIVTALDELDRQMADLAKDADPAERARIEQRLAELGEARQGESEGARRMRELVEQQLELANNLAAQLAATTVRRDRLLDLLKTLWLQIVNMKGRADEAAFDSGEISSKIRAISEDIQRYVEASDETVRMLEE